MNPARIRTTIRKYTLSVQTVLVNDLVGEGGVWGRSGRGGGIGCAFPISRSLVREGLDIFSLCWN